VLERASCPAATVGCSVWALVRMPGQGVADLRVDGKRVDALQDPDFTEGCSRAHWLHGKEYDAYVVSVHTATTLRKVHAHGRFVIVRLKIKNTLAIPHDFGRRSDLVFLLVDNNYFGENQQGENDPHWARSACATPTSNPTKWLPERSCSTRRPSTPGISSRKAVI
jgi:hypothetical protein